MNVADDEKHMNRKEFLKKLMRYTLFLLLGIIAIALGKRIVAGSDCSACPGKGICTGESDCSKFLSNANANGREEK
jgi:hypothetical protein